MCLTRSCQVHDSLACIHFRWMATVFALDLVTAVSLFSQDRATCLSLFLPPLKHRSFLCLLCLPSRWPRMMPMLRALLDLLDRFILTAQLSFNCLTSSSFTTVAVLRDKRAVSKQRLFYWILDAIALAYPGQSRDKTTLSMSELILWEL